MDMVGSLHAKRLNAHNRVWGAFRLSGGAVLWTCAETHTTYHVSVCVVFLQRVVSYCIVSYCTLPFPGTCTYTRAWACMRFMHAPHVLLLSCKVPCALLSYSSMTLIHEPRDMRITIAYIKLIAVCRPYSAFGQAKITAITDC